MKVIVFDRGITDYDYYGTPIDSEGVLVPDDFCEIEAGKKWITETHVVSRKKWKNQYGEGECSTTTITPTITFENWLKETYQTIDVEMIS